MKRTSCLAITLLALITIAPLSIADSLGQGYERVIVDDGEDRYCINASIDDISVSVDRFVVAKKQRPFLERIFKSANVVDIVLDVRIEGDPAYHNSVPIVFHADFRSYTNGTVVIPLSLALMSQVPLHQTDRTIRELQVDFSFVDSRAPTLLSRVVAELPQAAEGLSILAGPYSSAAGQISEILNNIVSVVILDADNEDSVSREGRLRLAFHRGTCGTGAAYSGTYLYIRSFESSEAGVVELDDILNHCFVKFPDTDAVFFEVRGDDDRCSYSRANLVRLVNPHFTVVVGITSPVEDGRVTRYSELLRHLSGG